jgi:pimeloyl-ACP methyl ester carboxylesterase
MVAATLAFRLGSAGEAALLPAQLDRFERALAEGARRTPEAERVLAELLMPALFWSIPDRFAYGLNLTIGCRENRPGIDASAARRAAQDLRPYVMAEAIETDYDAACPALGLPAVDGGFYHPVESDVPALILTGGYDTLTVPARAEALRRTLRRAETLPFRGVGHDVLGASQCARVLAARYLDGLRLEDAGLCPERVLPPAFATALPLPAVRP